ncbi:MAG: M23 family metallopeptidase, partial [Actinobacteria bacterium]|nr:M23 family metallopeptidase [Actinomycetota bacterium]
MPSRVAGSRSRRWLFVLVIAVLTAIALVAGGCTTGEPAPDGDGVGAPAPTVFTPVVASVVASPASPVLGTDGRYHVLYELELINAKEASATLQSVEVLDADQPSRVITSYAGAAVVGRLRTLVPAPVADAMIPAGQGRFFFVELTFGSKEEIPPRVVHHLTLLGAGNPGATAPALLRYEAAPVQIGGTPVPVLGPPLRGAGWVAANGCCTTESTHRGSMQAVNGGFYDAQRYAIDWLRIDAQGRPANGDPASVHSFVGYGSEVIAAADGTVVKILDKLPDQPPGKLPDPGAITGETVGGNHVVLDIGNGLQVFYAHLQPGSVAVEPGQRVTRGDPLGKLGNSGNTSAPHLHVHVMNGTSVLGSDGHPYVIDRFGVSGQVPAAQYEA